MELKIAQKIVLAALAAAFAGGAWAQTPPPAAAAPAPEPDWTFTGNVGLYSQYVFRGISQSRLHPALQGGVDYSHKSGFYVGTWASNISWLSDGNPDAAQQHLREHLSGTLSHVDEISAKYPGYVRQ